MNNELRTMNYEPRTMNQKSGFSLSEVLIAVGILAIGLVCIAGTFPVGIGLATVAVERTTAAVVAEEAFAKIKLYSVLDLTEPNWPADPTSECVRYENVAFTTLDPIEFAYPSFAYSSVADALSAQYYWSALCRVTEQDPRLVQVTVFVSRKAGAGAEYLGGDWPVPVAVGIDNAVAGGREFKISDLNQITYINPNSTIVDNQTGQIYRVLDRYDDADPDSVADIVVLDRTWENGLSGSVWVVPPPVDGGRYPCIGIYQRIIRF